MNAWMSDVRFGLRLLRQTPSVTVIAVLAMAIAIGVAGTVFSVANAVLIQPLPFNDPGRLVAIWQVDPANPSMWRPAAQGNYADWGRMSQSFEKVGAAVMISKTLTSFDEPDTPLMHVVSAGYFDALDVQPMIGRTFAPEEDRPGARALMVMSYELWQRRFGGDKEHSRPYNGIGRQALRDHWRDAAGVRQSDLRFDGEPASVAALDSA